MFRSSIEKRLTAVSRDLGSLREELNVIEEQHRQVADEADDCRLRAMVSETPLAEQEHREASKAVAAVTRDLESKRKRLQKLERRQDELLDSLSRRNADGVDRHGADPDGKVPR